MVLMVDTSVSINFPNMRQMYVVNRRVKHVSFTYLYVERLFPKKKRIFFSFEFIGLNGNSVALQSCEL